MAVEDLPLNLPHTLEHIKGKMRDEVLKGGNLPNRAVRSAHHRSLAANRLSNCLTPFTGA